MKSIANWLVTLGSVCQLLLFAQSASSQTPQTADPGLVYYWSFDKPLEKGTDSFIGNLEGVPGVHGMALKFDGFTTCIERKLNNVKKPVGALTVESWIALAAYPWAWSPIVDCSQDELTGFFSCLSC